MALTPLFAASHSQCELIDWDSLTESDIQEKTKDGNTLLHYAAYHGDFEKIPPKLREKQYWTETDNGTTILMSAFERGQVSWINPNDLTEKEILKKNGNGDSILTHAIFSKKLSIIPATSLSKNVLTSKLYSNELAIHGILRTGQLDSIPSNLLTEEILLTQGRNGETCYHTIASCRHNETTIAKLMSLKIWNQRTLTLQAPYDNATPLHLLACENPQMIPKEFLTKENLGLVDCNKRSVWHYWASSAKNWKTIPLDLITEEDLLQKDSEEGRTPLWHLAAKFVELPGFDDNPQDGKDIMSKILNSLSPKGLRILKSYNIEKVNRFMQHEFIKKRIIEKKTPYLEI
jgi:hypothetical protein